MLPNGNVARRVFSQAAYNYNMFVVVDLETYFDGVTFNRKDDDVHWNVRAHRHVEICDFNYNTMARHGIKRCAEKENASPYSHLLKRRKLNNSANTAEVHEETKKGHLVYWDFSTDRLL